VVIELFWIERPDKAPVPFASVTVIDNLALLPFPDITVVTLGRLLLLLLLAIAGTANENRNTRTRHNASDFFIDDLLSFYTLVAN